MSDYDTIHMGCMNYPNCNTEGCGDPNWLKDRSSNKVRYTYKRASQYKHNEFKFEDGDD